MRNAKIRSKIFLGFAIVLILGVALGIAGLISNQMMITQADELNTLEKTGTSINNVLNAHYIWRQGITEAALHGDEFSGSLDPNGCALGAWLHSSDGQNVSDSEVLALIEQISEPHAYIHTEAEGILAYVQAGDLETAGDELFRDILPKTRWVDGYASAL